MLTFLDSKDSLRGTEKCLDSQLWHACAGSMVQMPAVNSKVFYFPQGHAEHASGDVQFGNSPRIPPYVPCRVSAIKYLADPETDEVFSKIRLAPVNGNESDLDEEDEEEDDVAVGVKRAADNPDKPASFAKTLTQSDANNGGGFSVPRYCAETIFPRLDYSADPPVQTILAKDVHGETWKFRHIYRGTPRRHLLTTGWSTFVNHKKLVAGDSIVFLRAENGDLCVGIRRAKRGICPSSGWNPVGGYGGGYSAFLREGDNRVPLTSGGGGRNNGKVKAESVVEATDSAVRGEAFEVIYYPRAGTPEFCVKASVVKATLRARWCSGLRFKMPFETEDSSRISWFMGTISSVQVADPLRWPDSPWRLLQVTWDEPDLLQNVKRVSPWLVELVSSMNSAMHLSPFSPPRKKFRLPQHPDFQFDGIPAVAAYSTTTNHHNHPRLLVAGGGPTNGPYGCLPDTTPTPAGMQGARQYSHYGFPLSDLHFNNQQQQQLHFGGFFPVGFHPHPLLHNAASLHAAAKPAILDPPEDVSCLLTIGNSSPPQTKTEKKPDDRVGKAPFVLFGKAILTEQQISINASPVGSGNISSSSSSSSSDAIRHIGDEPFRAIMKTARRLEILMDTSRDNLGV
ncbi:hypothetical protein DM860_001773 [Cuscuta australis]|uniref:Auxin response factor n=1 Tax=Cuscuta australis TaxID=267555 RepID=A0A328E9A8_9ASTE|nr:hypothetical protein DM860_001773 [Cuscuta australis]